MEEDGNISFLIILFVSKMQLVHFDNWQFAHLTFSFMSAVDLEVQ